MKIIFRYIFFQFFPLFLIGFGFFTLVLIIPTIQRLVPLAVEKGTSVRIVLELFLYLIPFVASLTIPIGVLFSTLMGLGRLSSNSELIAMRANGFSVLKISLPVFFYGTIMSFFMLFFVDYIVPETNHRYRLLFSNIVFSSPGIFLETKNFQDIPNTSKKITALEFDGESQKMKSVYLYEKNEKGEISLIFAKNGQWINNHVNSVNRQLELTDGEILHFDVQNPLNTELNQFKKLKIKIESQVNHFNTDERIISEKNRQTLLNEIKSAQRKNKMVDRVLFVEYHKKIALPLACVFFVFIAIPLSITLNNRSGKGVSFGLSLVIIFIYYFFLIMGETLSKKGIIEASLGIYIPNLVVFVIGSLFFIKVIRD